jgi:hypothetical protein
MVQTICRQVQDTTMASFYLIDQSLRDEGSHHADYVRCIAWAAREAGFQVIIGANRQLSKEWCHWKSDLSRFATIKPAFRNTTYQRVSGLAGMQRMKRSLAIANEKSPKTGRIRRLIHRLAKYRQDRIRESIIRQFARDCHGFFQHLPLSAQDHIFFASISDLELIGLANYLAKTPRTLKAQWHVQFHFNLFDGRPPEYEQQGETLLSVRCGIAKALSPIVYHNLNLFTTTDELADQFNQLGVGYFEPLAYPIAKEFAPHFNRSTAVAGSPEENSFELKLCQESDRLLVGNPSEHGRNSNDFDPHCLGTATWSPEPIRGAKSDPGKSTSSYRDPQVQLWQRPLKVVCPGAVRREKNQEDYFQPLIDQVYESLLATKRIELIAQVPTKKIGEREKLVLTPPIKKQSGGEEPLLTTVAHPLPRWEYCDLLRSCDVGLLFYDSRAYFSRRAGILGELLSAGKPVIVPAGSWLAEQIAEPGFRHIEQHFAKREYRVVGLGDLAWDSSNVPMHGGVINLDDGRRPFQFVLPLKENDAELAIRFDWQWPLERGIYCRIEVEQFCDDGSLTRNCQILGHRTAQHLSLIHI